MEGGMSCGSLPAAAFGARFGWETTVLSDKGAKVPPAVSITDRLTSSINQLTLESASSLLETIGMIPFSIHKMFFI
jgi:hypothetical protein